MLISTQTSFVLSSKYNGLKWRRNPHWGPTPVAFDVYPFNVPCSYTNKCNIKKQVILSLIVEISTQTLWMRTLFNEMANIWICLKKLNQKLRNSMPWRDDIMLSEINTLMKWITKYCAREILMQFSPNVRQSIMYVVVFCN